MDTEKSDKIIIKIETLLSDFNDVPSNRFFSRMANAPWQAERSITKRRRIPALAFGAVLMIMVIIFVGRAPLSTLAESITSYFIDSGGPQITIHPDDIVGQNTPNPLQVD